MKETEEAQKLCKLTDEELIGATVHMERALHR